MDIFKWLFAGKDSNADVKEKPRYLVTIDLATEVQRDIERADNLETACQKKDQLIENLSRDLHELKSQVHTDLAAQNLLRAQKARVEQENRQLRQDLAASRKNLNRQNNEIQAQTKLIGQNQVTLLQRDTALKATNQQLLVAQRQISEIGASVRTLTDKCLESEAARNDLQFEMELLKCTTTGKVESQGPRSIDSSVASIQSLAQPDSETAVPPSPYAMVLVDGDGYYWAGSHFAQKQYPSGAHAAHAIKSEVQRQILSRKQPLHSKIITRVYSNIHCFRTPRYRDQFASQMEEFVESFTESTPLFDYIHAGRGKERVDEKIKENFHLHISDPYCHTIFLALTHDNGFARLLEQHICDPNARQKIVLVSSG